MSRSQSANSAAVIPFGISSGIAALSLCFRRAKTSAVGTGTFGLIRTACKAGRPAIGVICSPAPRILTACPAKQTGISAPKDRTSSGTGTPANCESARITAAASLEPPPSPAAFGSLLCSRIEADTPINRCAFMTRLEASVGTPAAISPSTVRDGLSDSATSMRSPISANMTRESNSWYPSALCPVTCSDRLTLAGANALTTIVGHLQRRCALFLKNLIKTHLKLSADAVRINIRRGVLQIHERQRAFPLEHSLDLAAHRPENIAKVIVDHRIDRHQFGSAFHVLNRFLITSEAIQNPSQTIDDVTAVGLCRDGALDHIQRLVQLDLLFDQRVPEVIQNLRLARIQLQCSAEIGFGLFPDTHPFIADGARVVNEPLIRLTLGVKVQRAIIGGNRLFVILKLAVQITSGHMDRGDITMGFGKLVQNLDRGIGLAGAAQTFGAAKLGGIERGIVARHLTIGFGRQIELVKTFKNFRRHQDRIDMIGIQMLGHPRIQQRICPACIRQQGTPERKEHLGQPVTRIADSSERHLLACGETILELLHLGIEIRAEHLVNQRDGIVVAFKL